MKVPFLIGRLLFGGYFLYSGVNHFTQRRMLAQYVSSKRVPQSDIAVIASGAVLVAGGASVLLGVKRKLGKAAKIGNMTVDTQLMHEYRRVADTDKRQSELSKY